MKMDSYYKVTHQLSEISRFAMNYKGVLSSRTTYPFVQANFLLGDAADTP
jgi:hypothetical protein